ncbi:ShlB/FhaC/HecB family hemolysin secretion/activation protein [Pleurocapsa sp. PCC 7319]|uniref:ShlB/FhaC/HecB family hemolysin secretion/activation protein n=1 Tax=Pleurocapsa sp. PCC 7319 TaxID=118161 RepID=UPI00130E7D43|nr:ShlB/FhaC/HecB family hemolysin secretion/activation protein [Pleurocapsa sp. PCC 7319]
MAIKPRKITKLITQIFTFFPSLITVKPVDLAASSLVGYILLFSLQTQANPQPSSINSPSGNQLSPQDVPGTIVLSKFEIIGNQVLPPSEIEQILQPYLFRPISFIELLEAQQAITQLLVERGYFTSGAFIPPQKINNRTVRVEIIEGKIEEIKISGLRKLKPEYIRSRMTIATQPPLNRDKLLNALQLLQLNPLIKNISAELSQGVNPGGSFLEIEIEEADTFALELNLDNQRAPSVGSQRRQVSIGEGNLLGFGDRLNVSYINTDGSNSLEDLSYVLPVGAYNSQIRLAHSRTNSQIITEPFQDLELETKNRYYEVTYSQPLYQTPNRELTVGLTFSRQNSQVSLMDIGFSSLSRGADSEGKTQISALRLFQEYSDRTMKQVFAVRSQFSIGIDAFDATINANNLPDSKFLIWRGQTEYLRMLTSKTNLFLRSELQLSDRPLVSLEQFSAGGALSVRGYSQDRILGDNGLFLSAELRNTLWQVPQWDLRFQVNPFFDFARVWNSDDLLLDTNTLASLGVGLQLLVKDDFAARLDWGIPLIDDGESGDSLQENGIHFSIKANLF